jgi:tetratricopeptide (TPR) repeat protein
VASAPEALFHPGEGEAKAFKDAFERGEKYFQAGDYGAAIANFREADRLRVTPEVAFDLAKCHEKLGDVAYSTYYFRLYIRRAPNAPDTLDLAEQVGAALAKAEAEGRGLLELEAPRALKLTVAGRTFDGGPVVLFLAPGDYEVEAEFPAGRKTMLVQLRTGKTTTVQFEPLTAPLVPLEQALTEAAVAAGLTRAPEPTGPGPSALRVGSFVVAGLGAAALIAGIALGASSSADGARVMSDRTLTVSQAQALANSANARGVVANVLFGVGGAAVAGGVVMFIFSMPEPGMKAAK